MSKKPIYKFANCRLETSQARLLVDGRPVHLTPKAFDTLVFLIEKRPELVTKDELMKKIWGEDTHVEEGNLAGVINELRKISRDDSRKPQYIETVPKKGYRFVAEVGESVESLPSVSSMGNTKLSAGPGEPEGSNPTDAGPVLPQTIRWASWIWASWIRIAAVALVLMIVLIVVLAVQHWSDWFGPPEAVFDFEDEAEEVEDEGVRTEIETMGWKGNYSRDRRAVVGWSRSTLDKRFGEASLKIGLDFDPSVTVKTAGEAAVDLIHYDIFGKKDEHGKPIELGQARDLSNRTITGYIKFNTDLSVDPTNPPGMRLFLKDATDVNYLYGCWVHVVTGGWVQLSLDTSVEQARDCGGSRSPQFDPSKVRRIGVSIESDPKAPLNYKGFCFLDAVNWPR